jgi:hypothetical protein
MGNVAIHVVDRGSSISAILWCLWSRGYGHHATAIFGIGARSPAAVWWCGR